MAEPQRQITDEHIAEAENGPYQNLEPVYFATRSLAARYMAHFEEEHMEPLAEKIGGVVRDAIWEDFRDFLLSDTESNLQSSMRAMVNETIRALLAGEGWAINRYLLDTGMDGEKIRAAVAKVVPKELQDQRIADLEAEVKRLNEVVAFRRY